MVRNESEKCSIFLPRLSPQEDGKSWKLIMNISWAWRKCLSLTAGILIYPTLSVKGLQPWHISLWNKAPVFILSRLYTFSVGSHGEDNVEIVPFLLSPSSSKLLNRLTRILYLVWCIDDVLAWTLLFTCSHLTKSHGDFTHCCSHLPMLMMLV